MLIVLNIAFAALVSVAASFLLLAKLHRQLSHMIEGRIFHDRSQDWPVGVHAKYRASLREWALHITTFALLGSAVGVSIYLKQQLLLLGFIGGLTLIVFYFLTKEVMKNFRLEEERNKCIFDQKRAARTRTR